MLDMFGILHFKKFFGEIQVGLLNKINKVFIINKGLRVAALITGRAWTGQKPETRVSRSYPDLLETRKEWEAPLAGGSWLRSQAGWGAPTCDWCWDDRSPGPNLFSGTFGWLWLPLLGRSGVSLAHSELWGPWGFLCPPGWPHTTVLFSPDALNVHTHLTALSALLRLKVSAQEGPASPASSPSPPSGCLPLMTVWPFLKL